MKLFVKSIVLLLCMCLMACALSGCNLHAATEEASPETEALSIYATFYPIYGITALIADGVPELQINCLAQPMDGCLRSYSLSDWDLALLVRSADAVIDGGRGLETFESTLYALGEDGPAIVSVLYNLELATVKPANETGEESHWTDENPHIYMTIDGAIAIAERITANLTVLDPEYADLYAENLEKAKNRLESLREEMHSTTGDLTGRKVIVMNEALVYAAREYGLDVELCYARESSESLYDRELEDCIEQLHACDARVILLEKQAPETLRRALEEAGFRVATLDVLSTRRASEGAEGYFEAQMENARALAAAFEETNLEVTE